jgi:hypothetical protein
VRTTNNYNKNMKNKLLLSSALVSGMIVGGSAIAQTSYNSEGVSGSLDLHYRSQSNSANIFSNDQMGRETQLNMGKSGKLNNGWDYRAGFSLEFDGNVRNIVGGQQTVDANRAVTASVSVGSILSVSSGAAYASVASYSTSTSVTAATQGREANSISNENVYIDLINAASGTTLTFGVDHIQNVTQTAVPQVIGNTIDNVAVGIGARASNTMGANPKENIGFGILQTIGSTGITVSGLYTPAGGDFGSTDQGGLAHQRDGVRNSAYEVGFRGADTLGVKGLTTRAFMNKEKKSDSAAVDLEGSSYGIGYVTGALGIGVEQHKQNRLAGATTTATSTVIPVASGTTDSEMKVRTYGVTYAVSPTVTIGAVRLTTEAVGLADETIDSFQLGYNLGPVAIVGAYSRGQDVNSVAGNDVKEGAIRLSTRF